MLVRGTEDRTGPVFKFCRGVWRRFTAQVRCSLAYDPNLALAALNDSGRPGWRGVLAWARPLPGAWLGCCCARRYPGIIPPKGTLGIWANARLTGA